MLQALPAAAAAGCALIALDAWRRRRDRAGQFERALACWREAPDAARRTAMDAFIRQRPECAAAWFLLGCAALRDGDVAAAARAFGAAYHRDCSLESAALLTFACLKASARDGHAAGLPQLAAETWEEMRRPVLPGGTAERRLLDAASSPSEFPPHHPPSDGRETSPGADLAYGGSAVSLTADGSPGAGRSGAPARPAESAQVQFGQAAAAGGGRGALDLGGAADSTLSARQLVQCVLGLSPVAASRTTSP